MKRWSLFWFSVSVMIVVGCSPSQSSSSQVPPSSISSEQAEGSEIDLEASKVPEPGNGMEGSDQEEQLVALGTLEQYLTGGYRNTKVETKNKDGDFATVVVTYETWDETLQAWIETQTSLRLRYVGGKWVADESSILTELTAFGQDTADGILAVTQEAVDASTAQIQETLRANLGGTLVYILEEAKQVRVYRPDGSESTVSISSAYRDATFENLELVPSGDGFYYSADTDWVTPALFYTDFEGGTPKLLKQFGGQSYIKSLEVSPDTKLLAVTVGGFTSSTEVWIIPAEGGEGYSIWESNNFTPEIAWSSDSNSLYINLLQGDFYNATQAMIARLMMDGGIKTIGNLPAEAVADDYSGISELIATSPNGQDIAYGGGLLGLLNINNGSNINISEMSPVCNPTWSSDGQRLVFASGGNIMVYDLNSGELTNPLTLDGYATDYNDLCPSSFDWTP